jgi:hypothetical protein
VLGHQGGWRLSWGSAPIRRPARFSYFVLRISSWLRRRYSIEVITPSGQAGVSQWSGGVTSCDEDVAGALRMEVKACSKTISRGDHQYRLQESAAAIPEPPARDRFH